MAKGKTQTEAYKGAGYAEHAPSASRLLTNAKVKARIAEIQERAAKRTVMTINDILDELEQARQSALTALTPQSGAAVAASLGKAKLLGLVTDRAELTGKDGAPLNSSVQVEFVSK